MAKKEFKATTGSAIQGILYAQSTQDTNLSNVIEAPKPQETHETHPETTDTPVTLATGKSCRFHLRVTEEQQEYIRIMSRMQGVTMTDFVIHLLQLDLEKNKETFDAIRKMAASQFQK